MKLTADTITDEQIRELRRETMKQWDARGKKTAWPHGRSILEDAIVALRTYRDDVGANTRRDARGRCAEILNARNGGKP